MNLKRKKTVSFIIKIAILCFAFIFIYKKLNNNDNLAHFRQLAESLSPMKVKLILCAVFFLMLVNWFLEALKWKYLVKKIEIISLKRAVESVFCGLTIAIFTPNRIGEYGGRIFFLTPRKRIFGAIAMGVGAIGQMVITNVTGAIAVLWFVGTFVAVNLWVYYLLVFLGVLYSAAFLVFYFNINWLSILFRKIRFLQSFNKYFKILTRYNKAQLFKVFLYCCSRFTVFTLQYYLVIHLLIPELPLWGMLMMIFILFFVQSALPSLDLLDVGVRSMTASYFFGFITTQEIAIMAAATCIWLVNLIIPAILGAVFVFKLNFFGTDTH